jgi:hypothetical protein
VSMPQSKLVLWLPGGINSKALLFVYENPISYPQPPLNRERLRRFRE